MGFRTYPARERDEVLRKAQRIARLEKAIPKTTGDKRAELEAELRALRLPPTV